ncbi:MAG: hypothetical protein ABR601_02995 [Parasphingopyxis sp.]|nr:hypothetical protein [Sphingomonadales bacterium]
MNPDTASFIMEMAPLIAVIAVAGVLGWVATTWMRIKNGYPLESSWGNELHPRTDREAVERVKLIGQENAQLRAELSSVKERLATIERIVTDRGYALDQQIESLRDTSVN